VPDDPKDDPKDEPDPKDEKDPKGEPDPKDEKDPKDWQAEAEKWKSLSRKHEEASKKNATAAARLQELEDEKKSDAEKAADKAAAAETRATNAERANLRLEVALDKAPEGMPIAQARKLAKRLTGDTKEELEADAAELFADFQPAEEEDEPDRGRRRGRPREKLRPGAVPSSEPEESDPAKLAEMVPRAYN
jgi:hypothetical protein